jgi:hypothetical protein
MHSAACFRMPIFKLGTVGGNSMTTVEPSRKRPISSPCRSAGPDPRSRHSRRCAGARRIHHAVPHRGHAADDGGAHQHQHEGAASPSNTQTTRSLRANRPGTPRAVAGLTENRSPRHVDHARSRPGAGHVDAVVVARAQVERGERWPPSNSRPVRRRRPPAPWCCSGGPWPGRSGRRSMRRTG